MTIQEIIDYHVTLETKHIKWLTEMVEKGVISNEAYSLNKGKTEAVISKLMLIQEQIEDHVEKKS